MEIYAPPSQGLDNGLESAITVNEVREAVLSSPFLPVSLEKTRVNAAMLGINVERITILSYIREHRRVSRCLPVLFPIGKQPRGPSGFSNQ